MFQNIIMAGKITGMLRGPRSVLSTDSSDTREAEPQSPVGWYGSESELLSQLPALEQPSWGESPFDHCVETCARTFPELNPEPGLSSKAAFAEPSPPRPQPSRAHWSDTVAAFPSQGERSSGGSLSTGSTRRLS